MSVLCCRVPGFHPSAFSFGNFVKHLAVVGSAGVASAQIPAGCAADPEQVSLPKFKSLDSRQKERVRLNVEALLQCNQKMNLTAVREAGEVMERHVEDSLAIVPALCD